MYNPAYNQNREVPQDIKDLILSEEGSRDYVYTDSEGHLTAGIGHKLTGSELERYQEGDKLRSGDRTQWFEDDVSRAYEAALEQAERYNISDEAFIARLTSTNFQLGENWWNKDVNPKAFDKLHNALLAGNYDSAAREAIDSNWYLQESGKDINRAEAFGDSIAALTKPVVRDPIEPTPDRRIASAGTDLSSVFLQNRSQSSFDQLISEEDAIGRASLVDPESISFRDPRKPEGLYEKFVAGFEGGVEQTRSDYQNLKGALNLAFGNDEAAQLNIAQAEFYEEQAATYLQQLTPFKDFYENPTFGGFIDQVAGGIGKITPQAMETVASAIAGGGVGVLIKEAVKRTGKAATKQLIKDALKKYRMAGGGSAGLKALSPEERVILEESWKLGNRLVKGGSITGAFLQEYKVGTSQSFSEFKEAGRELTSAEAFAALGLGLPQAIIGTAAEVLFAGALYKMALRKTKLGKIVEQGEKNPDSLKGQNARLFTLYKQFQEKGLKGMPNQSLGVLRSAQKDTKYFSNFARDMATLVGVSTVSEGTAEALQEGLTVTQRFAIDEDYDAADAKLRLAEATFLGAFAGGGARAVPGAAVTSIFNQARNALDDSFDYRARSEEQESRLGNIFDFKPESEDSLNAQLDAVRDPTNKKDTIWVREEDEDRLATPPEQPTEETAPPKQPTEEEKARIIAKARKEIGKDQTPTRTVLNNDFLNTLIKNFGVEGARLYVKEAHDAAIDNINADTTLSDDQKKARIAANKASRERALENEVLQTPTGQKRTTPSPKTFSFAQKVAKTKNLRKHTILGQGTLYSTDPTKLNKIRKASKDGTTGRKRDIFETALAGVLGYSEVKNQNHDRLLEVVNRKGEVVWQQTMDSAKKEDAVEAANLLFRSKGRGLRNYDEVFNTEPEKPQLRANEKYFIRERDPEVSMEERVAAATIEKVNEPEDEEPEVRKSTIDDTDINDFETAQAQAEGRDVDSEGRDVDSPDTLQTEELDFETQQQSAQTDKVKEGVSGFIPVKERLFNPKTDIELAGFDRSQRGTARGQPAASVKPIALGALIPLDDPLRQKLIAQQLVKPYTQKSIEKIKNLQQQVIDKLEGQDTDSPTPLSAKLLTIVNSLSEDFSTYFLSVVEQNPEKIVTVVQQPVSEVVEVKTGEKRIDVEGNEYELTTLKRQNKRLENRIFVAPTPDSRAFDQAGAQQIIEDAIERAQQNAQVNPNLRTGKANTFRWELYKVGQTPTNLTEQQLNLGGIPERPSEYGANYIAMNELLKAGRKLFLQQNPGNPGTYNQSLVSGFNILLETVLPAFEVTGTGRVKGRQSIIYRRLDGKKFADGNDFIDITNFDPNKTQTQETTPPTDPNRIVHFTLPENVAKILEEGFDTTKPPVHGLGNNDIRTPFDATKKIGKDVVYFTTDEDRWSSTEVYVGEGKGNIEAIYYDYDAQKWVTEQDAMVRVDLAKVEAGIKDSARVLTLDSYNKVRDYGAKETIKTGSVEAILNKAREEGYDVVNIKYENAEKWATEDTVTSDRQQAIKESFKKFTKNGGKDDYFILNEESIEVIPTQTQTTPTEGTPDLQTNIDTVSNLINNKRQELQEKSKSRVAEIKARLERQKEAALRKSYNTNEQLVATIKRFDREIAEVEPTQKRLIERELRKDSDIKAALETVVAEEPKRPATRKPTRVGSEITNLPLYYDWNLNNYKNWDEATRGPRPSGKIYSSLNELGASEPVDQNTLKAEIADLVRKMINANEMRIPGRILPPEELTALRQTYGDDTRIPAKPLSPDVEVFKLDSNTLTQIFKPNGTFKPEYAKVLRAARYKAKDTIPIGKKVGDIIPEPSNLERVFVEDVLKSFLPKGQARKKTSEIFLPQVTLNFINNFFNSRGSSLLKLKPQFEVKLSEDQRGGTRIKYENGQVVAIVRKADPNSTDSNYVEDPLPRDTNGKLTPEALKKIEGFYYDQPSVGFVGGTTYVRNPANKGIVAMREYSPIRYTEEEYKNTFVSDIEYTARIKPQQIIEAFNQKVKKDYDVVPQALNVDLPQALDVNPEDTVTSHREQAIINIFNTANAFPGGLSETYDYLSDVALSLGINPIVFQSKDAFEMGPEYLVDLPDQTVLDIYGRMSGVSEIDSKILDREGFDNITIEEASDMEDRVRGIQKGRLKPTTEEEYIKQKRLGNLKNIEDTMGGIDTRENLFTEDSSLEKMKKLLNTHKDKVQSSKTGDRDALWFGPRDYEYKGMSKHPKALMPNELKTMARAISETFGYPPEYFNSVLINRYNKGARIGAHKDDEGIFKTLLDDIGGIATVSYGGAAQITIDGGIKDEPTKTINAINGSVYLMPEGRFQHNYTHAVGPAQSERLSLTFRHVPSKVANNQFTGRGKAPRITTRPFKEIKNAEKNNPGRLVNVMRNRDGDFNFGNPWSHLKTAKKGTIKVDTVQEAVNNYSAWLRGTDFQNIKPKQRQWILDRISFGDLDNKTLLYYVEGDAKVNHALVLQTLVKESISQEVYGTDGDSAIPGRTTFVGKTIPLQKDSKNPNIRYSPGINDLFTVADGKTQVKLHTRIGDYAQKELGYKKETILITAEENFNFTRSESSEEYRNAEPVEAQKEDIKLNSIIKAEQEELLQDPESTAKILRLKNANIIIIQREALASEVAQQQAQPDPYNTIARRFKDLGHEFGHAFLWQELGNVVFGKDDKIIGGLGDPSGGKKFVIQKSDGTLVPIKNPILDKLIKIFQEDVGENADISALAFEEWYADKFAAEMFNFLEGKKPKNAVESLFHRIFKRLQRFYASLSKEAQRRFGTVPEGFQQYMQNVRNNFKQGLVPKKVSVSVLEHYEARKSTIEAAAMFNNLGKATKQGVTKVVSTFKNKSAREIWGMRYLLYPTDNLMKYYEKSELKNGRPKIQKIIKEMRQQMYTRSKEKSGPTPAYLNEHAKRNQRYFTQFLNIFNLGSSRYLSKKERDLITEVLLIAEDWETFTFEMLQESLKADPNSQQGMAFRVRRFLEKLHDSELSQLGVPYNKEFFPRAMAIFDIINDPAKQDEMVRILTEDNAEELKKNPQLDFREVVDRLLTDDEASLDEADEGEGEATDLGVGGNRRRAKYFKKIKNSRLRNTRAGDLLKDPAESMREYINSMAKRIQYNQSFVTNIDNLSPSVEAALGSRGITISQAETDQGFVTGWKALEVKLEIVAEVDPKLEAKLRHILRGQLGKAGQDMGAGFRNVNSFLLFFNAVTLLTLAPLASFPDLAGPMLHGGDFKGFTDGLDFVKSYAFGGKEGRERARQFALDLGVVAADSLSLYYINAAEQNYMNPMFKKGTDYFFRYTGLEAYTQFTRIFAAQMGKRFMVRAAEGAKKGDTLYSKQLDALGVTPEQVFAAAEDNWAMTGKVGMKHIAVRSALGKFVDESIVRPNAAERPGWANNPYFATVWQLKSFYYAYGKVIMGGLGRTVRQRYGEQGIPSAMLPLIMGAALLLPLTALGLEIRELLKYILSGGDGSKFRTNRLSWGSYMAELTDRAGIWGPFGLLIPMYESQKYGDFFLGPALGPSAERVEDLIFDFEIKQNIPVFGTLI